MTAHGDSMLPPFLNRLKALLAPPLLLQNELAQNGSLYEKTVSEAAAFFCVKKRERPEGLTRFDLATSGKRSVDKTGKFVLITSPYSNSLKNSLYGKK